MKSRVLHWSGGITGQKFGAAVPSSWLCDCGLSALSCVGCGRHRIYDTRHDAYFIHAPLSTDLPWSRTACSSRLIQCNTTTGIAPMTAKRHARPVCRSSSFR